MSLDIPQANLHIQTSDVVWYKTATNQVVGFGETEEEIQPNYEKDQRTGQSQLSRKDLFASSSPDLHFEEMYLEYQTYRAHILVRPNPIIQWLTWYGGVDEFDYELEIAGYETWRVEQRLNLEYLLQSRMKTSSLRVNNRRVGISKWKRSLNGLVQGVFTSGIPVGVFLVAYAVFRTAPAYQFLAAIITSIIVAIIVGRLGVFAWVLLMRDFVPREYLRYKVAGDAAEMTGGLLSRLLSSNFQ